MKKPPLRRLSRRQFLKGSAAAGLVTTLPGLLGGCGSDDASPGPAPTPMPGPGARERRTLQFDLSANGTVAEPVLNVLNSTSYRAPLRVHDAASRARFRESTPELREVADEHLTHYLEGVDLPADALQLVTVMGTANGLPAILGAYIHVPSSTSDAYAANAMRGECTLPVALMNLYGTEATEAALAATLRFSNAYITPLTTAVALCFHHPEVMNLNTDLGANTLIAYIQDLPADCTDPNQGCKFVDPLAFWIATHSPATTAPGGWAQLVAQTDADGKPVLDQNGNQVYRYDLTDDTREQMAPPVQQVLRAISNDQRYEGSNWNATQGLVEIEQTPAAAPPAGDSSFLVQATLPVGSTHNGVEFVTLDVADASTRAVQLTIRNRYLRWLRAYAQYFTPEGVALPVVDPGSDDTSRAKYITQISSNNQIMGIPLQGDDVSETCIDFEMPAAASRARIYIGSLGLGGEAFCPEALDGSALTLAFNIGVPAILLALGIGETASSGISQLVESPELRNIVIKALREWVLSNAPSYAVGIYGAETSKDAVCFITALGNSLVQALLTGAPIFVQFLAIQEVGQAAAAIPIVGWIFKGLEIASALAAIAVTFGEVMASKALMHNDVSLSFDLEVTIEHDADDFRFPPEADTWEVRASLSKSLVFSTSGTIDPPGGARTAPIQATIANIPAAGEVTIDIVLKSSTGWIAAAATVGPLPATPESAGKVTVAVKNRLVPLTSTTQYQHDIELQWDAGARAWTQAPAPTATVAALACATDQTLCQLGQVTISPRTGMLGYSWRTGGLGVGECGTGTDGVLDVFQNVLAADPADSGLKFPGCGWALPAALAYDPQGPPSGAGNNFYIRPALLGGGFSLHAVVLDDSTPIDPSASTSYGRFTQALDRIAVHPAGYVVGVAAATHKIEILELPEGAPPDDTSAEVPWAVMRAGLGSRAGLLDTPVAVTIARGAVIVLEQGNLRLQAFDLAANPVLHFAGKSSPLASLVSESAGVVYVDLAADLLGYLYVLSYTGDGAAADDYRLDIYEPDGTFLVRTTGVAAGAMTVDPFRTLYALNYATVAGAPRLEPSLSQWIPSTPSS